MTDSPEHSSLGKSVDYLCHYDARLLFPLSRAIKRQELGITTQWPFYGEDLWTAYEVSWLTPSGKPQVAIIEFVVPASSEYLIESKSIKLYLNSFNQTLFASDVLVANTIADDLSKAAQAEVAVQLFQLKDYQQSRPVTHFSGSCLDEQSIDIKSYQADPELLSTSTEIVKETLYSDLLKSNCLVTGQPDWGSVQIQYQGAKLDQASLLQYLIGFRQHHEFHEQCVERIFIDLWRYAKPSELTVYARYTRRGGIDINPIRSSIPCSAARLRLVRQ